jgi:zinc and cadmium transporter
MAFIGALTLLTKRIDKIVFALVAFAAGALMGGAFFHLISETLEHLKTNICFSLVMLGFVSFFILERFLKWHHCHKGGECEIHPFAYLNLIGDSIHNFIDGIIIGASFIIDINLGIMTTLLIILHEIPQELGDFGVLIYAGLSPKRALFYNFISQLTCILGGIIGYYISVAHNFSIFLLPIAAGGFIYIAASDLIPELREEKNTKRVLVSLF